MDEAIRKKIGDAQKKSWASGNRKPIPQDAKDRAIEAIRLGFKNGRKPTILASDHYKRIQSLRNFDKLLEINRKNGALRKGKPNQIGKTGKCESNIHAKEWELKSPENKSYKFINLNEFIRKNTSLFSEMDVNWFGPSKNTCLAAKGLRKLFYMKKNGEPRHLTWKGWRIGDKKEIARGLNNG